MFPSFSVLGKEIGMYSLCAILGLLCCGAVAYYLGKKQHILFADIVLIMLSIVGGVLIGGHLLYGLIELKPSIQNIIELYQEKHLTFRLLLSILITTFGGGVFYGGLFGAIIAIVIHTKSSKNLQTNFVLDIFAVTAPLFQFFGRIGCFLGGCCYGIESKLGFTARGNAFVPEINNVSRFPVQLAMATCNLFIFIVLFIIFKHQKKYGKTIYTYLLMYSPMRFALEFLRGDIYRGFFLKLSTSQWISLIVFCSVIILKAKPKYNSRGTNL